MLTQVKNNYYYISPPPPPPPPPPTPPPMKDHVHGFTHAWLNSFEKVGHIACLLAPQNIGGSTIISSQTQATRHTNVVVFCCGTLLLSCISIFEFELQGDNELVILNLCDLLYRGLQNLCKSLDHSSTALS